MANILIKFDLNTERELYEYTLKCIDAWNAGTPAVFVDVQEPTEDPVDDIPVVEDPVVIEDPVDEPLQIEYFVKDGEPVYYNWSWNYSMFNIVVDDHNILRADVTAYGGIRYRFHNVDTTNLKYVSFNIATNIETSMKVSCGESSHTIYTGPLMKQFCLPISGTISSVTVSTVIQTQEVSVFLEYLAATNIEYKGEILTSADFSNLPDPITDAPLPDHIPVVNDSDTEVLVTNGNKIVKQLTGEVWQGRGVNIFDTRSCNACSYNAPNVEEVKRRVDLAVDTMGSNFLRLCMESYVDAGGRVHWEGPLQSPEYVDDLVEIVNYIGQKQGVYVMISLWIEPTFDAQGRPTDRTAVVWKYLASIFKNAPHVIFGVSNEPESNYNGADNQVVFDSMQVCVDAIRDDGANNIISVQGVGGWSRIMNPWVDNQIQSDNIVYECHPYNAFDPTQWYNAADTLPVILGEFGPVDSSWATMTNDDITETVQKANEKSVSWLGWSLHHRCPPNMLVDHGGNGIGMTLELNDWGNFIMDLIKNS